MKNFNITTKKDESKEISFDEIFYDNLCAIVFSVTEKFLSKTFFFIFTVFSEKDRGDLSFCMTYYSRFK